MSIARVLRVVKGLVYKLVINRYARNKSAHYVVEDEEEEEMIRELLRLFQRLSGADQRFALGLMRRMGGGDE